MIFGDFEILADSSGKPIELGRGGMGVTYRARQISMGREVARDRLSRPVRWVEAPDFSLN